LSARPVHDIRSPATLSAWRSYAEKEEKEMITAQERIALTTPSLAGTGAAADPQPSEPSIPINLPVSLLADGRLSIPDADKYLQVDFGTTVQITWALDASLSDATFDKPGISMFGESIPGGGPLQLEYGPGRQTVTLTWQNTNADFVNRSYYYRIHVIRNVNGVRLPLSHDPVVHNDPPGAI
jgi:hypothetical protein